MLWPSEHLHLGDEGRAGAQGQERKGGHECQSAICPRQASDSRTFRGAGAHK